MWGPRDWSRRPPLGYMPRNRKEGFAVHQSTDLTVFTAPTGDRLRVVLLDDQPWFVAQDVASALDLGNISSSLALLDDDEKALHSMEGVPGQGKRAIVSEPGLYALMLRSRRPEAKVFKRWVTHDVLPTIRRSGGYSAPPKQMTPREMALAVIAAEDAKDAALRALASTEQTLEITEAIVERVTASQGCLSFAQAAQTLGMGQRTLLANLGRLKLIVYRVGTQDHLRPYENHRKAGRFEVEAQTYVRGGEEDAPEVTTSRTRITPKGLIYIAKLLQQEGALPPRGRTWLAGKTSR